MHIIDYCNEKNYFSRKRVLTFEKMVNLLRTPKADSKQLIKDISKYVEPVRPGRRDTRNIKAKSFVGFVYRVSA